MRRAVNHAEGGIEAEFLIGALQFVSLVDRHLRILIAMQKEKGRIQSVHVGDRAGEGRQFRRLFR